MISQRSQPNQSNHCAPTETSIVHNKGSTLDYIIKKFEDERMFQYPISKKPPLYLHENLRFGNPSTHSSSECEQFSLKTSNPQNPCRSYMSFNDYKRDSTQFSLGGSREANALPEAHQSLMRTLSRPPASLPKGRPHRLYLAVQPSQYMESGQLIASCQSHPRLSF